MRHKKYNNILTFSFLKKEYINNKRTMTSIGKQLGVDRQTVSNYIDFYLIPKHNMSEIQTGKQIKSKNDNRFTKDFIYREYILKKKSTSKIAKQNKTSNSVISRYLDKYKIRKRTKQQAYKLNSVKNNYRYGLKNKSSYIGVYKNTYFRSLWEINFAKWCDLSDIKK